MDYENITERRILVFGDSNTYGYDPERDGRYGETERYPCRIQALLGPGWTVIEEGLPGRTAVFDDPVTEGLCGLSYLTPCMMSHAPLDTLVVINKAKFDGLSPEFQQALVSSAQEAGNYQRKLVAEDQQKIIDGMKEAGVEVITDLDRKAFSDALGNQVRDMFVKDVPQGADLLKAVDEVQ